MQQSSGARSTKSRIRPALIPETAPVRITGAVKPVIAQSTSPGESTDSSSNARSHVKSALAPPSAPALPRVIVKPALVPAPAPKKPQNP
jgi:hypothetical protein